ncbi:MAG: hypothetical protein JST50_15100 [Bacteroidetes bacterium]|nr:hypothetical protein [Bacteroidota bacterium]
MSYCYKIYGLKIKSSRTIELLPEHPDCITDLNIIWTTDEDALDNELEWQPVVTRQLKEKERIAFFRAETPDGPYFKVCFFTDFGKVALIVDPAKINLLILHDMEVSYSHLDSFFVGSILGCILRLKGILCLHASVINIEGHAILLTGKKRSGKSSTAKAFAELGFKILSDDIAVITITDNNFLVQSGYPKIRLRPKPLELFYPDSNYEFVTVYSHRDSKYTDLNSSFWNTPLPLGAIYILGETEGPNDPPFITTISAERMIHLHSNTFASYIITPDLQKKEFEMLGRIARAIPVQYLHFGRNINLVYQQCETILEDLKLLKDHKAEL